MEVDISNGFELASFHYEVKSGGGTEEELDSDSAFGKCDNLRKIVKITKNYNPQQAHTTFTHELFEALNSVYIMNLKHDQITHLGNGMAQILKSLGIQFVYGS